MYRYLFLMLMPLWAVAQNAAFTVTAEPGEYTIEQALQKARLARLQGEKGTPVIELQAGTYRLSQPVILRPEDNGTRIVALGDVRLSGGVAIDNWRKEGRLWVADVPLWNGRPLEFRQLWVNGRKAIRARDVADFEQMHRILSVDKAKEIIYVPRQAVAKISNLKSQREPRPLHAPLAVADGYARRQAQLCFLPDWREGVARRAWRVVVRR